MGAAAYNFANNLTIGSTGNDVTQLQTLLIADGYLSISAPTSYFGQLTKAAVEKYQAANNITPRSGYVGPLTRGVLNRGVLPTTSESNAMLIAQLQAQLQTLEAEIATMEASSTVTH